MSMQAGKAIDVNAGDTEAKLQGVLAVSTKDSGLTQQARKMLNSLVRAARLWSVDNRRVRGLVTFQSRTDASGRIRAISQVATYDRPEIELYLWHRDQISETQSVIDQARTAMTSIPTSDPAALTELHRCLIIIDSMTTQKTRHVAQMEKILAVLSIEQQKREKLMAEIATNGARLAQAASQHDDKIKLAQTLSEIPTVETLRQKLAVKYGVPVDQVEAILSAKTANLIPYEPDAEP